MPINRYIVEFGVGIDFHGQSVTRAAEKAVRDATSKSTLCGLKELLGLTNFDEQLLIKTKVAVTRPEEVDKDKVAACLPVGKVEVEPVLGGMSVDGMFMESMGDKDPSVEVAVACIEVFVVNPVGNL